LFTFSTKVPLSYIPSKSTENSKKKIVGPSDFFIIGDNFLGHALYKGQKTFFTIWTSWVSKDAKLYIDFKNINLHYSGKMKEFLYYTGAPCVLMKIFILEYLLLDAFCH
jgi:hypothetical protein